MAGGFLNRSFFRSILEFLNFKILADKSSVFLKKISKNLKLNQLNHNIF